jgi:hypothetical protein
MRLTLKSVNEELTRIGSNAELVKGSGYFLLSGGEAAEWIDRTIRVANINGLTLKQWIEEYHRLKALNEQLRKTAPGGKPSFQQKTPQSALAPRAAADTPIGSEAEAIFPIVDLLTRDLGQTAEPSTAVLLYALLQTPSTKAHSLLGTLPPDARARLAIESWQNAQIPRNGVPLDHLRHAARRISRYVCDDAEVDTRHLLLTCLVGSGFLASPPEVPVHSTATQDILGRSNAAVHAIIDAGIDPIRFLDDVRSHGPRLSPPASDSFFLLIPQGDRTRILRVEDMGEFFHAGKVNRYPATLGLLEQSLSRPLPGLLEFEALINNSTTSELQIQRFLETHPEFLLGDEYILVHPGILLTPTEEFGLKPDFFLMRRDAPLWDIAELKLPTEKLTTGRAARHGLAAAVHKGMDQLRRYRQYFLDTNLASEFREKHGMELYFPRLTLVIGRDATFGTYQERQRLTPLEARILTYDDLLRLAKHRSLVLPSANRQLAPPSMP